MAAIANVSSNSTNTQSEKSNDFSESNRWGIFWLLLLIASIPMLIPYFMDMWIKDWYRYFPFAIVAIGYLVYVRSDHRFYPPRAVSHWGLIAFGLFWIAISALLHFTWFAALGFFFIGVAFLASMRGQRDASLIVLAVPLMMLIRLPLRTDSMLVIQLQQVTTWLSSVMLDLCRAPHAIAGNVIQLSNRELFVAEACSGIQSVFTLAFVACLLIAINRRRVWLVGVYLLISALLAVAANVIRVTIVALGEVWFDMDLASGLPHELVGYFALTVSILFLLSFDQLVVTSLHSVAHTSEGNPLISAWNYFALRNSEGMEVTSGGDTGEHEGRMGLLSRFTSVAENAIAQYGFIAVTILLAGFSGLQLWRSKKPESFVTSAKGIVFQPPQDLLASSISFLSVKGHEATRGFANPRLGANSDVWHCQVSGNLADKIDAQFVLSQPHTGWHELCDCYERLDWVLAHRNLKRNENLEDDSEEVVADKADPKAVESDLEINPDETPYVVARFKRAKQFGYLLFAGIGSDGQLVSAPSSLTAFTHRVWNRIDTTGVWEQNEVIMLQLWVVSPKKLDPETIAELEDDFVRTRSTIAISIQRQRSGDETILPSITSPMPAVDGKSLALKNYAKEESE